MKLGELCELTNSLIEVRFNEGEGESFFIIKANASFQKKMDICQEYAYWNVVSIIANNNACLIVEIVKPEEEE